MKKEHGHRKDKHTRWNKKKKMVCKTVMQASLPEHSGQMAAKSKQTHLEVSGFFLTSKLVRMTSSMSRNCAVSPVNQLATMHMCNVISN